MKLKFHEIERRGDNLKITGLPVDRMRRPGKVEIKVTKDVPPGAENVIIEGDAACCTDTIFALANIAWSMGWRPEGLTEALVNAVRDLK